MKKFRRIIAIICIAVTMALTLVGCGKKTCSICGKKKSNVTTSNVLGKEVNICKDCKDNPLGGIKTGLGL